jgi:mono/diheme cytochrome c family protein
VRCWEPDPDAPPRRGLLLYVQNCRVCHEHGLARPIEGLFGATLELQGGGAVVVDEPFIVESILDPPAHVTSGAQPFMPTFRGQLTSHDLRQLVELYRWCRDRPLPAPGAR